MTNPFGRIANIHKQEVGKEHKKHVDDKENPLNYMRSLSQWENSAHDLRTCMRSHEVKMGDNWLTRDQAGR